jgi:hypothetical protein
LMERMFGKVPLIGSIYRTQQASRGDARHQQ